MKDKGIEQFLDIKDRYRLIDIFRMNGSQTQVYSYFSDVHKSGSRLDRVYATDRLAQAADGIKHTETVLSDHRMVSCAFKPHIFNLQLGYSYWKFNTYNLKIEQN